MKNIRKFQKAVRAFRALDSDIPIGVIVTFLEVALEDGVEARELVKKTQLGQSSQNRALVYLGDRHWSKSANKPGLGLVEQTVSDIDQRVRVARLTQKGKALAQSLEDALE